MLKAEIPGQKLVITQPVHSGMNPPPALGARLRCWRKGNLHWNMDLYESIKKLLFPPLNEYSMSSNTVSLGLTGVKSQ